MLSAVPACAILTESGDESDMSQLKNVVTVREGDSDGNRMVVRLETEGGRQIHAVGVPQDNNSRTGPTWAYLFENDGMTLIDAGATGSYRHLAEGVEATGYQVRDIERAIITHGHQDHDGAAGQLAEEAGAEIWAHDIYAHLLQYNPWDIQRNPSSPLQREMQRVVMADRVSNEAEEARRSAGYAERQRRYVETRRKFKINRTLKADEESGDLGFMHAPGHSPDEICVTMDGLVFTGDHVLPEITPHPTTKARFSPDIRKRVPEHYHCEDEIYGLETYLRSLRLIANLGDDVSVLPAHRLFSKGRFNFETTGRAVEILEHHVVRLGRILHRMGTEPTSLEHVTRGVFARRKLIGGNLYMALSEIVAHIELLEDAGDLEVSEDMRLRASGSENYRDMVAGLG